MKQVPWLKDCDICNVGLCKRMDELTASVEKGGKGFSERKAAKEMEKEAEEVIGEKVWSAKAVLNRYQYHTGKKGDSKRVTPKNKAENTWDISEVRQRIRTNLSKEYEQWPDAPEKASGFRKTVQSILREVLHE